MSTAFRKCRISVTVPRAIKKTQVVFVWFFLLGFREYIQIHSLVWVQCRARCVFLKILKRCDLVSPKKKFSTKLKQMKSGFRYPTAQICDSKKTAQKILNLAFDLNWLIVVTFLCAISFLNIYTFLFVH